MYVQAYDMGSPSKTSATNATVTIDVYRNLRNPFFSGGPFAANIPETSVIGTSVLQINFGDSDTDVSVLYYFLIYIIWFATSHLRLVIAKILFDI